MLEYLYSEQAAKSPENSTKSVALRHCVGEGLLQDRFRTAYATHRINDLAYQ